MAKLQVNTCCGCISLRTGALIIAVFATFIAFAALVGVSIQTASGDFSSIPPETREKIRELYPKIALPYTIIIFLVDLFLLVGVIKAKREFMLPYLVLSGATLVYYTFTIAILMIAFPVVLLVLAALAIASYLWTVVYSYYRSLAPPPMEILYKQDI